MHRFITWFSCAGLGLVVFAAGTPAHALSCTAAVSTPTFGSVNLLTGNVNDTAGSMTISCAGSANEKNINVVACPSINAGTGNAGVGGPQRYLRSGGSQIKYNMYSDAYVTVWSGIGDMGGVPPKILVALGANGTGSSSVALYARIAGGQGSAPTGTYTSDFLVDVRSTTNTALGCASVVTNPASPTSFSVAANYASNCLMQTSNLDFGTIGALNSNIDAETTLAVTCSTGNVYTVALDGGAANATDPALRRLNNNGTTVIYGLYRNATRTNGWGADATTAAGGTGNGLAQVLTVYGRIPKQPFPPVGTYQDTIVVTLTY